MVEKGGNSSLNGRKLYIFQMTGGARALAAVFRSIGGEATITPASDEMTLTLGAKYISGDECYPEKVTIGDFLKVVEDENFVSENAAFFMPTAGGPCRFGQYATLLRKVLDDLGYDDIPVISPTSSNSYEEVGGSFEFLRTAWRALVSSDILLKVLLKTRPYELEKGQTDEVYDESLKDLCRYLEDGKLKEGDKLKELVGSLTRSRDRFRAIPADYTKDKPFIGVVGEIFCRLNDFSNNYLVRKIEEYGGECWLSDVSEWIWYTNNEQFIRLRRAGKRFSLDMLKAKIKNFVQRRDEHKLMKPFHEDFIGYEEPGTKEVLESGEPYLPYYGSLGEMALSVGKAVCLYSRGSDGIVDISPFTCMNGTVSEAVYPALSKDCDGIPVRVFYFDENQSDLDRDVGIFIELTKNYKRKKRTERLYPPYFGK